MRQLYKYLVVLSLLLTVSINYSADYGVDTSNVTKACGSFGAGGSCGGCCGPSGSCCGSGCGSGCGPCNSCCGTCFSFSPGGRCGCDYGPCGSCVCPPAGSCGGCCGPCPPPPPSCNACGCNSSCNPCGNCCDYFDRDCCCKASACGYPFFAYRSQGINAARNMVGWTDLINKYDTDTRYGTYSLAVGYTRSFEPRKTNAFLFGKDLVRCNTLYIQGSHVKDRDRRAWLADYFGLPNDFNSKIQVCPLIQNVVLDFNAFLGLDHITEGLYFRVNAPLTWTSWQLNMREYVGTRGANGFHEGYMSSGAVDRAVLPENFTQAMSGCYTWGDMKEPIKFGRITNNKMTKLRIADVHAILGWNFCWARDRRMGINARLVIPTGNKLCCKYLFEPQIGDRKHWQLGLGLSGQWILWRKDDKDDHHYGLYIDANLTHLFNKCQCRSFDFKCKPNSRYMLLAEMGNNEDGLIGGLNGGGVVANFQYKKKLIPAINYTTLRVNVKVAGQLDFVAKLGYVNGNFSYDWGYNLWVRSRETLCYNESCGPCCDSSCCGPCGNNGFCSNRCCSSSCNGCGLAGGLCCNDCCNDCCGSWSSRCGQGSGSCCDCTPSRCFGPKGSDCGLNYCCENSCGKRSCGTYVIKGDAAMYGYKAPIAPGAAATTPIAMSSSECNADIHSGTNAKLLNHDDMMANKGVDNPQVASSPGIGLTNSLYLYGDVPVPPLPPAPAPPPATQLYTSIQPKTISVCDLNMCQSPLGLSHKLFYHISYAWKDREDNVIPFIGMGYELEFGSTNCMRFGVSQWGAWFKGGFYWE